MAKFILRGMPGHVEVARPSPVAPVAPAESGRSDEPAPVVIERVRDIERASKPSSAKVHVLRSRAKEVLDQQPAKVIQLRPPTRPVTVEVEREADLEDDAPGDERSIGPDFVTDADEGGQRTMPGLPGVESGESGDSGEADPGVPMEDTGDVAGPDAEPAPSGGLSWGVVLFGGLIGAAVLLRVARSRRSSRLSGVVIDRSIEE